MMKSEPRGENRGFVWWFHLISPFSWFPHLVEPLPIYHCRHDEERAAWGRREGSYGGFHIGQLVLKFILVIAVVIRRRFCYYRNRMLMLVNWREGSEIAWINIYPPMITSAMEMKRASDRTWRLLKRRARTSLVAELKSSGSFQVSQILLIFLHLVLNC